MRASGRGIAWFIALGLATSLIILRLRGGDAPADKLVADESPAAASASAARQPVPASMPEPRRRTGSAGIAGGSLADECAQLFIEAAGFATAELDAATPEEYRSPPQPQPQAQAQAQAEAEQREEQAWSAELGSLQRSLAGTGDPGELVAALVLDQPGARVSEGRSTHTTLAGLGERASNSDSPLLAWHALRICASARELCPYSHLEQKLLQADRQNAEAWALVALLRYRRGDVAGALAAMQGAAQASTSTWYWTETIATIERALDAGTDMPYQARLVNAVGSAAAALPDSQHQMCRDESSASRAWAQACLAFGELRGKHNETMLAQGLALAFREQALTALGDSASATEVRAERALHDAEMRGRGFEPGASPWILGQSLLAADPARLPDFLRSVQEYGESAGALEFLRKELPSLLERASLLGREGAQECVARLREPLTAAGTRAATAGHRIQVGDELVVSARGGITYATVVQVQPDGTITTPRAAGLAAVGKTTWQLEQEIATTLPKRSQPPEVIVVLLAPRSGQGSGADGAGRQ